jgi:Domain of unknown function (DUF5069)
MEPLDLRAAPPRSPYVELGGLYMLARTIDKIRATLPGGNTGVYQIKGFSQRLLDALGIPEDDLRAVVSLAAGDDEIAAWVLKHSDPSKYAAINEALESPTVGERLDRPDFLERYPNVKDLPSETTLFQMLDIDDAQMFAKSS